MNTKQTKEAKRAVKMKAFAESRVASDFTHVPPTPVDLKHAATIAIVAQCVTNLGGEEAIQQSGMYGQQTEEQQSDRGDVEAMLRKVNTTVAAIARETKSPGMMDRFRMPHDDGDRELAAKLKSFALALEELNLFSALADHALVVTKAGLEKMATDLIEGAGKQGNALSTQVGATASIPETLKIARGCKLTLDAIYGNVFDGNTGVLAAWKSASHVERDGGGEDKSADATPVAPK